MSVHAYDVQKSSRHRPQDLIALDHEKVFNKYILLYFSKKII